MHETPLPTGSPVAGSFLADVAEASRRLNATLELEDVAAAILRLAQELTGAGAASLAVHDTARRTVRYIGAFGQVDLSTDLSVPEGRGTAGWAVEHDRTLILDDPSSDARLGEDAYARMGASITNLAAVPLRARGAVCGAVEVMNRPGGFTPEVLERLEVMAEPMGLALENARLYRRMRKEKLENEVILRIVMRLNSALALEEVLDLIIDSVAQIVPYAAAGIYLVDEAGEQLDWLKIRGYPEEETEAVRLKLGVGLVGDVAKTGRGVIVPDVTKDPRYVKARPTTRSEMVAPLVSRERVIGAFNLESDRLAAFTESDLERLNIFAAHAVAAIEKARLTEEFVEKRRLEEALAIARRIQRTFLPHRAPNLTGFDMWGVNVPSEEVGGDYFDFIDITPGQLGLAVADVSGKGIPAALIMAAFRASLRAEIRNHYAIRTILSKVNRLLNESLSSSQFVTAVYGVLDVANRRLTYSNAGHNPPLLRRANGSYRFLDTGGLLLGPFPEATYSEKQVSLESGDLLVMYTDGVTEAYRDELGEFGLERLQQVLEAGAGSSAREICESIVDVVNAFRFTERVHDDLTVLVVRAL
jgi:sigma-B regulation protein RsbU (phosphoserine phosphatase)